MITCYARSLGRDQRQNVLVEEGVVVKEYVVDGTFQWAGNPELIGQPEASLQSLGFEQVPGPLKRHWGSWVNVTLEEVKNPCLKAEAWEGGESLSVSLNLTRLS